MLTKYFFISITLIFNLIPFSAQAVDEGLYKSDLKFLSIKKYENLVTFHFIQLDTLEWQAFSGFEDPNGNVYIFDHGYNTSAEWKITTTKNGVDASMLACLGDECDGPTLLQFDLFLPDTGESISGIYQSLAFQNLIVHEVGNQALSIDLSKDPGLYSYDYGIEIARWDLQEDDTWRLRGVIFSTLDQYDPFDGDAVVVTGVDNEKLNVTIENCVPKAESSLDCDEIEYALSARTVF